LITFLAASTLKSGTGDIQIVVICYTKFGNDAGVSGDRKHERTKRYDGREREAAQRR
jgi:hypothetical protein